MSFLITFFLWINLILDFSDPDRYTISGFAQGTTYQIIWYADSQAISKQEIENLFSQLDSSLSIYKPYSLISRFNASDRGIRTDPHLQAVVSRALEISEDTDGAFDITIYPLVEAWGFGLSQYAEIPDSTVIATRLNCVGNEKLTLKEDSLFKTSPCVKIDVNGIAQGYSVDLIASYLEQAGIKNYLVEVGGEIKVGGSKPPSGDAFIIGLESPPGQGANKSTASIGRKVALRSGALTTSGSYRRFREHGDKKITHLIDPHTGQPVESNIISVTVMAEDAMTADGYDNALMVMSLEKSLHFLQARKDLEAYFIYKKPDGSIADTATTGFYRHLE